MALTAMKSEVGRGYFGTRDTAPNVSLYKKHIGLPAPTECMHAACVYRQVVQEPPSVGAEISSHQLCWHDQSQSVSRSGSAEVSGDAVSGNAADPCTDRLDHSHQRKTE